MIRIILFINIILGISAVNAQYPSGDEILDNIDKNMSANNRITESKMVIHGQRGSRTIESKSWSEGEKKAFTEYTAPAREKGTKMLKLENNLWLYSPATDRTISISGHMLRQSVMGSDLSYEDMMEDPKLRNHYDAVVVGTEEIDAKICWIVELIAKTKDIAYHMRKIWVDQQTYVPLKEELYAKSGKLLKKLEFKDIIKIQGRWYPSRMIFKDMLKSGKGTEFIIENIKFDQNIPSYIFTKATLRK
jgi:outer membrane lipoprotein-sorting protein